MTSHPLHDFIRRLCRARSVTEGGHLSDTQLLERFIRRRDEAAFEVLVWRHGTLVLNVARRLLRQAADVEDVFQAAFLTLARKASSIRRGTSLSSWLYKVTYRIALRLRQAAARPDRQTRFELDTVPAATERGEKELAFLLAEEVNRLPERHRAVVVLCYLQGVTTEEAARLLGCPRGTVLSRLSSARQRLQQRLVRRGIAPAVALAAVSVGETASAGPSVALVTSVVAAALPFAAGGAAVPMVSSQAAALAQGALQTMLWNKIKIGALIVCVIALAGTGSGWLARSRSDAEAAPPVAKPAAKKEGLPEVAPDLANKRKKEIAKIHKEMEELAKKEEVEEARSNDEAIEARLQLAAAQDELRLEEQKYELERELNKASMKDAEKEVDHLEKFMRVLDEKKAKEQIAQLSRRLSGLRDKYNLERDRFLNIEKGQAIHLRPFRRAVYQAEYKVRRIDAVQTRLRDEFIARRQTLRTRLEHLENKDLAVTPADQLREVESKLDALRREVGELRRALQRQGNDPQKKP